MTTRPKPSFYKEKRKKKTSVTRKKRKVGIIENLEFKELPLHSINNLKSTTDLKLNADPIYDFEDDTEDNKYEMFSHVNLFN